MADQSEGENRALLRVAVVDFVLFGALVGPIALVLSAPSGPIQPSLLVYVAVFALVATLLQVSQTRARWRRIGGFALRRSIDTAVRERRLPDDADPTVWTYPLALRSRALHQRPWGVVLGIAFIVIVLALAESQSPVSGYWFEWFGLEAAVLVALLIPTIRGRRGKDATTMYEFLDELDRRAGRTAPA
jgi:membrane protease YdiL (CAAX protease family)